MIRAVLALFLLAARPALACRCDASVLVGLNAKPETAKTALLGKAEQAVFRVEASWTRYTGAVALSRGSKCDLRPAPGKRLIFLSIHSLEWFEERKASPTVCDSMFLEPAKAERSVRRLVSNDNGGYHFGYNPSWGWCRKDKDCVLSPGVCGGTDAVHERSKSEHEAWRTRTTPRANCVSGTPPKNPSAKCVDSFCAVSE